MSLFSSLSASVIGVILLVLFGLFYWLGIAPGWRAAFAFIGTILLGTAGFLGGAIQAIVGWLVGLLNTLGAWAFGVGAVGGLILTIITGAIFIHDMHPKHTAGKRTGWAGVALAALLIAGVSGIPALNGIPGSVQQGVTNAKTILGG